MGVAKIGKIDRVPSAEREGGRAGARKKEGAETVVKEKLYTSLNLSLCQAVVAGSIELSKEPELLGFEISKKKKKTKGRSWVGGNGVEPPRILSHSESLDVCASWR